VVEEFLSSAPDAGLCAPPPDWPGPSDAWWSSKGYMRLYPHRHGTDGFFAALLKKR